MEVQIYGTPVCPNCDKVKTYLSIKEVPYSYSAVGDDITKEELEAVVKRPVRQVPVIVVDGQETTFEQLRTITMKSEPDIPLKELKL